MDCENKLVGTTLADRYQLSSLIGKGATSCVFQAHLLSLLPLTFLAFLLFIPITRLTTLKRALFVVENCQPERLLIRAVDKTLNYNVSFVSEEGLMESTTQLVEVPTNESEPFWDSLVVASQLVTWR